MTTYENTEEGSFFKIDPEVIRSHNRTNDNLKFSKYLRGIHEEGPQKFYMFYYNQLEGLFFEPKFIEIQEFTIIFEGGEMKVVKSLSRDLKDIKPQLLNQFPAYFTGIKTYSNRLRLYESRDEPRLVNLGIESMYSKGMRLSFISNSHEWNSVDYFTAGKKNEPTPRFGHSFIKVNENYGYLYGGFVSPHEVSMEYGKDLWPQYRLYKDASILSNELWRLDFQSKLWERCLFFEFKDDVNYYCDDMTWGIEPFEKAFPPEEERRREEVLTERAIVHEAKKYESSQTLFKPLAQPVPVLDSEWVEGKVKRDFVDYAENYPPSLPNRQTHIIDIHDKAMNCIYYIGNENRCSINCLTFTVFNMGTGRVQVHEMRKKIGRQYTICDAFKDDSNNTIVIFSNKIDNSAEYVVTIYCLTTHKSKSFHSEFTDLGKSCLRVRGFQLKFIDDFKKLLLLGGKADAPTDQIDHAIYVINWREYRSLNVTPWINEIRKDVIVNQ